MVLPAVYLHFKRMVMRTIHHCQVAVRWMLYARECGQANTKQKKRPYL